MLYITLVALEKIAYIKCEKKNQHNDKRVEDFFIIIRFIRLVLILLFFIIKFGGFKWRQK